MSTLITSLVAFAFGFIGSIPLTGPIAVMVFSLGVQRHYGAAVRVGLGAALAEAIYAAIAFWGFTTFLANRPLILPISHGVSALILLLLGAYFLRWKAEEGALSGKTRNITGFLLGLTISALNPTLLATWSAAVGFRFHQAFEPRSTTFGATFGAAAGAGVACWELLFIWLLRRYENHIPRSMLTRVVRVLGLLLFVGALLAVRDLLREL